ncbi:substrate-binding domain-containing protein [Deinococcus aerophilus]|uniref:HTH cro/C1-type domain-containing protein n=1 Tax=Deinococcus aerophilus TaxID=522488 RepID=A0ABQ2GJH9_9DEIO|nr:substrate-binding domain-containing protein [Deinococcus aerophilus]GGL98379.1 hypothetical protein GCM10010841_03460 [Deinococcus aerophilus]
MSPAPPSVLSRVRAVREQSGERPGDLAQRAGITRQALHAIEAGVSVPSTAVALRLAHALSCRVEDLFQLPTPPLPARALTVPASFPTRVQLAYVGEQLLALPLSGEGALTRSADGVGRSDQEDGALQVDLLTDPTVLRRSAVVAGCDPSLGLLIPHAARLAPSARVLWHDLPSLDALRAVARGEAHAAGIHLHDPASGDHNRPWVERELRGRTVHLFTLWTWEQGLIVAAGNPRRLRAPADLARPGIRLANRNVGAGSRLLLDAWLETAGLDAAARRALPGYDRTHASHLALAQSVARGEADAGPGPRAAARAWGLDFVPLHHERFDLALPAEHLEHPGVQALLGGARLPAFHAELAALGGYDPRHAGELWQTTA